MNMKILNEIKKKVKPGKTVYYMDKNNKFDPNTIFDPNNDLEKDAKNQNNWQKILEAIYDGQGSQYVVSPNKSSKTEFTVIDKKNNKNFIVKMHLKDNALVIENLLDKNKTTIIETASVMDSDKDTPTADKQVDRLIKNLKSFSNKSPKELKEYLTSIIKTI